MVVDGSGGEGRDADVACRDGVISAIEPSGREAGRGATEIDGRGLCLAPGFIDPHTHLDANLFWDPDLTPSSGYGVTTVVTGNCGYTLAPVDDATRDYVIDVMSTVEAIPREALIEGVPWDWSTLEEYFARLARMSAADELRDVRRSCRDPRRRDGGAGRARTRRVTRGDRRHRGDGAAARSSSGRSASAPIR